MSTELLDPGTLLERLLEPVSPEAPAGERLQYDPTYDRIREARRAEDPNLPRDVWQRELKAADWRRVEELCVDSLGSRSKDLQLAAWLLEAWLHRRGLQGIADGLEVLSRLSEAFWENAFPALVEEEPERRASPFVWINEKLIDSLAFVPVARESGVDGVTLNWGDVRQARWTEQTRARLRARAASSEESEAEVQGPSLEEVRAILDRADKDDLGRRIESVDTILERTRRMEAFLDDRMGDDAPSLVRFRSEVEEISDFYARFAKPATAGTDAGATPDGAGDRTGDGANGESVDEEEAGSVVTAAEEGQPLHGSEEGPIRSREDAYRTLLDVARYLERIEPHSPTPYLIKRAVAWGDMTLSELLREFVADGLDLHALFVLLGLDEEGEPGA